MNFKVLKKEIKWNKEEENKVCGIYGNESKLFLKRQWKSAWKLEKKVIKSYDIRTTKLWPGHNFFFQPSMVRLIA